MVLRGARACSSFDPQGNCTDEDGNFYECGDLHDSDPRLDATANPVFPVNGPETRPQPEPVDMNRGLHDEMIAAYEAAGAAALEQQLAEQDEQEELMDY